MTGKELTDVNKSAIRWFFLCPVRHVLLLLGAAVTGFYFAFRGDEGVVRAVCRGVVRPWHAFMGRLCSHVRFSVAEAIYAALILGALVCAAVFIARLIRRPEKLRRAYRALMTLLSALAVFYGGFCLLWGFYYQGPGFQQQSGVYAREVAAEDLYAVTEYFARLANEYSAQVPRDEGGVFSADGDGIFAESETLYTAAESVFPCLEGEDLRAKPIYFSKVMSLINFTGFFFPFTGEANVNVDSPQCMLPSTIAHELAHQRGVAREDEANFVAVAASLAGGSAEYKYSASLLALIHLSNALYETDPAQWADIRAGLSAGVVADFKNNNAYWEKNDTIASDLSETVYNSFLEGYGDDRGTRSYGACVDLLVAYYKSEAVK